MEVMSGHTIMRSGWVEKCAQTTVLLQAGCNVSQIMERLVAS